MEYKFRIGDKVKVRMDGKWLDEIYIVTFSYTTLQNIKRYKVEEYIHKNGRYQIYIGIEEKNIKEV